ncbi:MAG: alkylation response protein AidB-like acyl-CoA dehydrogenase [Candidatus Azotimanducaceae bacterium]|jgi:alkylation response protein AidB-like acyl-CoA dehydrogenase
MSSDIGPAVINNLEQIANTFAKDTKSRQTRSELDPADFKLIADAGFLLTGVPADQGGLWQGTATSARSYATMVRTIAHGDPCVALVAAMHPAVMVYFLGCEQVTDGQEAWLEQRQSLIDLARNHWWGTVTSEPGSGGDMLKTKTIANKTADDSETSYIISGNKHFGSGSGHADFMITTAKCDGNNGPDLFYVNLKDEPWDGSTGCTQASAWDGIGMTATQSHAFKFENFPATKTVTNELLGKVAPITAIMGNLLFTAVAMGIADNALSFAAGKLKGKMQNMRSFERIEWNRCRNEIWLAQQAFEGATREAEASSAIAGQAAIRCKITVSELLESALTRMSVVVGGASFSKGMPLAQWNQDVRALGFLRPPLPFAHDILFQMDSAET